MTKISISHWPYVDTKDKCWVEYIWKRLSFKDIKEVGIPVKKFVLGGWPDSMRGRSKEVAFRIIHHQEIECASLSKPGFLDNPQKLLKEKDHLESYHIWGCLPRGNYWYVAIVCLFVFPHSPLLYTSPFNDSIGNRGKRVAELK